VLTAVPVSRGNQIDDISGQAIEPMNFIVQQVGGKRGNNLKE